MSGVADRGRVQRAAVRVGLVVGIASAVAVAIGVAVLVVVLFAGSRPDTARGGAHGGRDGDVLVVDVDHVLPWVLALGAAGVLVLGLVAWLAARRATVPLAEALRVQRDFVADASHELRTPLATLNARVQVLARRQARGEPTDEVLQGLRSDVTAMDEVLADLLLAAEEDADLAGADGPTSVRAAAERAASSLAPLAEEAGVRLVVDVPGDLRVALAIVRLTRLVVALVDNAVRHSPAGGAVTVSGARQGRDILLRVVDEGGGIRGIDPERVFDRFARAGGSGGRRGFGIGLALVRDVAVRAGGSATVGSTSERGTTFLVRLPAA